MSGNKPSDPFRSPDSSLTDDELHFWDRVFCTYLVKGYGQEGAASYADKALETRREKFGRR